MAVRTGRTLGFGFGRSRAARKFGLGLVLTVLGGYGLQYANAIGDTRTKAIAYNSQVKEPFFDEIRYNVDKLELLVDDNEWVLSKYRELLFLR